MTKSLDAFERSAGALADAALSAATCDAFRREALETLRSLVAFDFGIIWGIPESLDDATLVGFPPEIWRHYFAGRERFGRDIAPLVRAAFERGVVNDRELFDARTRERLPFYDEIIKPVGSRNFLTAIMGAPSRGVTAIQLGRAGRHGSPFNDSQRVLGRMLPVLSLGEALHKRSASAASSVLSPREREVASYISLGLTSHEIGLACGMSAHTVDQQTRTIFRKLDVANRAELERVMFRSEPPASADNPDPALTPKEREVLELFEHGASYQDVARILQISVNTVRDHVRHIYEKLHVTSKVEAVMKLRNNRSKP
jgi:DNA-binding CsgD family transcriptional regulator